MSSVSTRIAEDSMIPPESPDMKFARDRLGTLLTSIRHGDTPWVNPIEKKTPGVEPLTEARRGPGRPRKVQNKDKPVIFELRGKPFSLRDGQNDSMYQLCRAWMRGKASDPPEPEPVAPPPVDASLDLLVMRDITALPQARSPYPVEQEWPDKSTIDKFDSYVDPNDITALRQEYARHWKQVKAGTSTPLFMGLFNVFSALSMDESTFISKPMFVLYFLRDIFTF
ncbi:hypothetical protein OESDEN_05610 [Oesophagostomum dentatum]|uniref:Uncharacterized protein n=1 Tax=Oesophagostomum dentatum TaxID=61180 RepID=A0A0B1TA55_OESDE|nr:hypothetical protein OESDEN_05610 [Oesophagostomum dentatum]